MSVSVPGIALGLIAAWFSLSSIDYDSATNTTRFVSGGWFILGFPFVLMIAAMYGAAFAALARRTNWLPSILVLVALSGLLSYTFAAGQLPSARLREVVGEISDPRIAVKRFRSRDSFNGGETTHCVIALPRDLLPTIIERRHLETNEQSSLAFAAVLADGDVPEMGTVYFNNRMRVYYDQEREMMYVYLESG